MRFLANCNLCKMGGITWILPHEKSGTMAVWQLENQSYTATILNKKPSMETSLLRISDKKYMFKVANGISMNSLYKQTLQESAMGELVYG